MCVWTRKVWAVIEDAIDKLLKREATIKTDDAPDLAEVIEPVALPLVISEAKRRWSDFLSRECGLSLGVFASKIASPDVAEVFQAIAADETTDAKLDEIREDGCVKVKTLLDNAMEGLDALVYPKVPIAAPALHTTEVSVNGVSHPLFPLLTDRALVASLTESPAVFLPIKGFDKRPLGLELLARRGNDTNLLGWAAEMETHL